MTTATFYAENRNNKELTLFENVSLDQIQTGITNDGQSPYLLITALDHGREVLCLVPGVKYDQFVRDYIMAPEGTLQEHIDFRNVQREKRKLPMYFIFRRPTKQKMTSA